MLSWPAQGSGIIMRIACGSDRPVITRNSSTLSKVAVSLPPSRMIGRIFCRSSPRRSDLSRPSRARIQLMLPVSVLISPLCAMKRYGMRERPRRERVGAEALVHERERRLEVLVRQVGEHRADLPRREHAFVDERPARQARDVERLLRRLGHRQPIGGVLDALSDDVELPFEGDAGVGGARAAASPGARPIAAGDEDLPEGRLDRDRARSDQTVVGRHVAPAKQRLTFFGDDGGKERLERSRCSGVARQKDHADAVLAGWRQRRRRDLAQEPVRHLHHDAGAVAGVDLAAARAAMREVHQHLQRLADDVVRFAAFHVHDEADAAGVMLVLRIVQARGRRRPRDTRIRCAHFFVHNIFQEEPPRRSNQRSYLYHSEEVRSKIQSSHFMDKPIASIGGSPRSLEMCIISAACDNRRDPT